MKTSIKRMLCLLVSVCICFASLPIIFGVMADASEPELSLSCENIIELDGKSGEFGSALDTLRINSKIKFGSAKDFSFVDIIELSKDVSMVELDVKPEWIGKNLLELNLRKKYSLNIVAIKNNDDINVEINPESPLEESMKLIVIANTHKLEKLN